MFRYSTWLLPRALTLAMPIVVLIVLAVSQVSAIVDFSALASAVQRSPLSTRAGLAVGIVLVGALEGARVIRGTLYRVETRLLWRIPVSDAELARLVFPSALVGVTPAFFAGLLGWRGLLVYGLAAMGSLAWVGRRPAVFTGCLVLAALTPALWPLALGGLVFTPFIGRGLRDARPLGDAPPRSRWLHGPPVAAMVQRDLLGLWRDDWRWLPSLMATAVWTAWAQSTLARSWDAATLTSAGAVWIGMWGWLPAHALAQLARIQGASQLARGLPIACTTRLGALQITAALPLLPMLIGLAVGGARGLVTALPLAFALVSAAVWRLVSRSTAMERRDLSGFGIASAVFLTAICLLHPLAPLAVMVTGLLFCWRSYQRLSCSK